MKRSGQMTVFLSMIILSICALMSGLLESARTAGTRWYFKMAAASSLDSVMSGFHRELWDRYHLLLLEAEDEQQVEEGLSFYMKEYQKENHLYPMTLEEVKVDRLTFVTDYAGEPLEKEIVDYMRFGFLNRELDIPAVLKDLEGLKEAGSLKDISGFYEGHSRQAFLLEQSLEAIQDSLLRQEALMREAKGQLEDWNGPGFIKTAGKMIKEMERMPGLMKTYEDRADDLGRSLDETETIYRQKKEDLSNAVVAAMEAEMEGYREYTDQDGRRRQEIVSIGRQTQDHIPTVQAAIDRAEEVMEYIASWEGDDEDDELDEGPLWRSVINILQRIRIPRLEAAHGIGDKEKKDFLDRVRELVNFELMKYVLPEGRQMSSSVISSPYSLPSEGTEAGGMELPDLLHLPTRLAVAEYGGIHFNDFTEDQRLSPEYELEYLIAGKSNDEANLEGAVRKLLMVREGMNLVYLLTDQQKMEEARALATVIVGALGMAPLVYVMTFFIVCIWALGEALMDVKTLLAGGKVPLVKDRGSWNLSLDQLLKMGEEGGIPNGTDSENGFSYETYIKLLMMLQNQEITNYRIMDLIQVNIGKEQKSYQMNQMVYRVEGTMGARGRYLKMRASLDKSY